MLGVTFVFAKNISSNGFFNVRVKSLRGFALKLSQSACLPQGVYPRHGIKDAYLRS